METKHNFDDLRDAALPQFPKAVYHDTLPAVVVSGPEELKELGPGWRDHPDMAYAKFVTGDPNMLEQGFKGAPTPNVEEDKPRRGRPPKE